MRPREWVKNGFVLAPLVFSGGFDDGDAVVAASAAFAAFCAVASAGYLVNDVVDADLDRAHPAKRRRPVAAGELSRRQALALAVALSIAGICLAAAVGLALAAVVGAYVALATAYSLKLKHVVIVDVMAIVALFLARVVGGAIAIDVDPSEWLLLCTGMVSLFLGFAKRRQEAVSELHLPTASRPVLEHYSLRFLDQMIPLVTAGTIMSYAIYATESPIVGSAMLATTPPVLYGIFRYLYLVYHCEDSRSPAVLVTRDVGMLSAIVVWAAIAIVLIYA